LDVKEVIFSRASVRVFRPDPLPVDVVNEVLEAGVRAPIAGGVEKWFFVVVMSEGKRRKIHELLKEAHVIYATKVLKEPYPERSVRKWVQSMEAGMYYAPAYIAGYIDMREPRHREEYVDEERIFLHQTIAAAFQNMILTAWSLGIGSVWIGVPLFMKEEFNKVLEPPEGLELAGILALGHPTDKPKPKPRKTLEQIVKYI